MLLFFLSTILEYGNFGGPGSYGGMPPQFNVPPPGMGGGMGGGGYPGPPAQGANFGGQQQPPPQSGGAYGGGAGGNQGNYLHFTYSVLFSVQIVYTTRLNQHF